MEKYPICNHREETAPKLLGRAFILCWRCTGVMISFVIMVIVRKYVNISFGIRGFALGSIMMLPMIVDGGLQYFSKYESTNEKRIVTGMLFGIGFSLITFILYK